MAIQPIDMQTLFSQLEKVGKTQAHQQQGAQIQNAIQQEQVSKRLLEKQETVEQTQDAADGGVQQVKERAASGDQNGKQNKKQQDEEVSEAAPDKQVVKDPSLGQHIDVSG